MNIAVQYKKINLNEDDMIFIPIGIIEGDINSDGMFEDLNGILYESVDELFIDNGKYYFNYEILDELKRLDEFKGLTIAQIKKEYFRSIYTQYIATHYNCETDMIESCFFNFNEFNYEGNVEQNIALDGEGDLVLLLKLRDLFNVEPENFEEFRDNIKDSVNNIMDTMPKSQEKKKPINLKKLRKTIGKSIISQEKAINDVTRTIALNYNSKNPKNKSHILIAGPTGTGKTEIMNIISRELDVPIYEADATAYTKEGYVGKSVYSMLEGLLTAADNDLDRAQNGILIIDEIDKKVTGSNEATGKDVFYSLLKIMDRSKIELEIGPSGYEKKILFDTSNLTIVFMGAFEGLYKTKMNIDKSLGFNKSIDSKVIGDINLTNDDFLKYGMPSEFMGRIGKITYTKDLTSDDLIKILKKSDISQLKLTREFLGDMGVDIKYSDGYVEEVAMKTIKLGTGARGLKNTVLSTLDEVYDSVLVNKKVKKIVLSRDTVYDSKNFRVY